MEANQGESPLLPHTQEVTGHRPVLYRPAGESRHTIPAEICEACSDVDTGQLVPASFCDEAKALMEAGTQ